MTGTSDLAQLIKSMAPKLNEGDYVFVTVDDLSGIDRNSTLCEFKEQEGTTVVIDKKTADALGLAYDYVAAWITLKVHSSLSAVGFTAAFSDALTKHRISSNVIAGYYHDHIFVAKQDAEKAMRVLMELSNTYGDKK